MKALVTGGGGFVGTRIVEMLRERGEEVVALGRRRYPHLEQKGIPTIRADLRDPAAMIHACEGIDVVFHAGAVAGIGGAKKLYWDTNVVGTRNVIAACRARGVSKLVYTSSPSVVFGSRGLCGVDESQAYPDRYLAPYPETKAAAEKEILAANSSGLATVALRPHLIWGPGDPHLIPRVIERARQGRLRQVGDGSNLVDITYIDNAAEAHLLAAEALHPGAVCAGRAYFISQGKPVRLWDWLNEVLTGAGIEPVTHTLSFRWAYRIGRLLELFYRGRSAEHEPPMTRFLALQLAKSHYFNIAAACRDLGYVPRVSTDEGMIRLVESRGRGKVPPEES